MKDEEPPPPTRIQRRLIESAAAIEERDADRLVFMHTVLCQTSLPYRDAKARDWERRQGNISLRVSAGASVNPDTGEWVELALPFGSKPRLILAHLNREALIQRSPVIEVQESLTGFVKRIRGFDPGGREIRAFKDQLACLSAATVRLAMLTRDEAVVINTQVVTAFNLWFPRDERQRVLWPSVVRLSADYFQSLMNHAVPLDERAIGALAHSALALDVYCWLAQRLHRVNPFRPQFIPWDHLHAQFGWHYGRVRDFKRVFRETLDMVHSQYRAARIELGDRGMTLRNSPPPIKGRAVLLNPPR
jgi:hypothetical protein